MQRVTNCVYIKNNQVLLLLKPSRGWWSAPGGKVEDGESIADGCVREFYEETNLTIGTPKLSSVFNVVVKSSEATTVDEWLFFTFKIETATGQQLLENHEGRLVWHNTDEMLALPMAEGDQLLLRHALHGEGVMIGTFTYTEDYELLNVHYSVGH